MNTDDMAFGGSGYPVDVTGEATFEAVDEEYNGKPYHIKLNLPPLAGIYFMKVKDPAPKKAVKKPAAKKAPAKKAAPKKTTKKTK
jgi:1,4-alpha-glucan branching enzyme